MRIECPGCETAYEVPETQIRPGRSVRCTCCDRQWLPVPEPAEAPDPAEALDPAEVSSPAVVEEMPGVPDDLMIPAAPEGREPAEASAAGAGRVRLRQSGASKPVAGGAVPIIARFSLRLGLPVQVMTWMRWSLKPWGLGWAATLVVLAGLLVAAGYWRTAIMQDWPPSIRLYTALGARSPRT